MESEESKYRSSYSQSRSGLTMMPTGHFIAVMYFFSWSSALPRSRIAVFTSTTSAISEPSRSVTTMSGWKTISKRYHSFRPTASPSWAGVHTLQPAGDQRSSSTSIARQPKTLPLRQLPPRVQVIVVQDRVEHQEVAALRLRAPEGVVGEQHHVTVA